MAENSTYEGPVSDGHSDPLSAFQEVCARNGYTSFNRDENTDVTTLLRFLRANQYDIKLAFRQFHFFQSWRRQNKLRDFYENIEIEAYETSRKMYPQWIGRRDKEGQPIYVFPIHHFTKRSIEESEKRLSAFPRPSSHSDCAIPTPELHLHALYENLLQFVLPICSAMSPSNTPISSSTHIVDVSGVSIIQWWSIRKYLQQASVLATLHYPETLGRVFVVGAPAYFKSIWDVISQWFDPGTRSKIYILSSSESSKVMLKYIDATNLPQIYGGELDWAWHDQPNLDTEARRLALELHHTTGKGLSLSKGPMIYRDGCIRLLGSVNGIPRRNEFCRM